MVEEEVKRIAYKVDELLRRETITGDQVIVTGGLSDISGNLGLAVAGEFRAGNGIQPGLGFSGVRIGYPAFQYGSDSWHIVGVNNDTVQFGLRATDGVAIAGAGTVKLDNAGVTILAGQAQVNWLKWESDTFGAVHPIANVYSYVQGGNNAQIWMTGGQAIAPAGGGVIAQGDVFLSATASPDSDNKTPASTMQITGYEGVSSDPTVLKFYAKRHGTTKTFLTIQQTSGIVFNDCGMDIDFRIESDTDTHKIFIDAANSHLIIDGSAHPTGGQVGSHELNWIVRQNDYSGLSMVSIRDDATAPINSYTGYAARGTIASPSATQAGDYFLILGGRGYDDAGWETTSVLMALRAAENYGAAAHGAYVDFDAKLSGTTARVNLLHLGDEVALNDGGSDVDVRIESDTNPNLMLADAGLSVLRTDDHWIFKEKATPATPAAGYVALFADTDGMLSIINDTGGITKLA